ncbi:DUF1178 family protein [Jiella sp. M17.18]|uniref:DUF1178 family protein n=1 Tax=Jiella sp. M17.18 TaxID=3234247 RepID=UPI0034DE0B23
MIRFALRCRPDSHQFDGWFRSNEDFESQVVRELIACPVCGSVKIGKALMRPAVSGTKRERPDLAAVPANAAPVPAGSAAPAAFANAEPPHPELAKAFARLQELAREVRAKADYVGPKFAEEARRIHYGETEARQIYGEASPHEVKDLHEEGITALPLPPLPEDKN